MKVIYGSGRLHKQFERVVAAIGVFDAIHRGHQKVIRRAVQQAKKINGTSVVLTFYPHPVSVIRPKDFSAYVLTLRQRLRLIEDLGADVCCVIEFNKEFSLMSPECFVRDVLVGRLGVAEVVVGEDFYFGRDRAGSFDILRSEGKRYGFLSRKVSSQKLNNIDIKTRNIKKLICQGDLENLKKLLGRHYSMEARVERGDRRGRRLGYPTANLKKENVVILPCGIYLAHVFLREKKLNGLFYVGHRPSFKTGKRQLALEAHVLDHQGSLYGRTIAVEFLEKVRNDRAFPDEKSLSRQIARDVAFARAYFRRAPSR